MADPEFRLVGAGEPIPSATGPAIKVSLREIFPLLAAAHQKKAAWLADLADEPVLITSDLAEILVLYREMLKESA
jgi:hypothetical protein